MSAGLETLTERPIQRAESVDFTGDGLPDFILSVEPDVVVPGREYNTKELWVSSDGTLLRSTLLYRTPIWERWFVELDDDPELELLTYSGYEDGADAAIADQIEGLRAQQELFRFLPVFRTPGSPEGPHAWGLPWNLDGARVAGSSSHRELACSFDFPEEFLEEAGAAGPPIRPQRLLPVVFFESPTVPRESRFPIQTSAELSLGEIVERSRARVPDVIVTQPTLVALFPQHSTEIADPDNVDVASDFRWHLAKVRAPLTLAGIAVSEYGGAELIIQNGDHVEVFVPDAAHGGIAYYLVAPRRGPRILQGVQTDVDLLLAAARYFEFDPRLR